MAYDPTEDAYVDKRLLEPRSAPSNTRTLSPRLPLICSLAALGVFAYAYFDGNEKPKDPIAALVDHTRKECLSSGEINQDAIDDVKRTIGSTAEKITISCETLKTPDPYVCTRIFKVLNGEAEIEVKSANIRCVSEDI